MFCRKCGNELSNDAKFCKVCGEKVVSESDTGNNEKVLSDAYNVDASTDYQGNSTTSSETTKTTSSESQNIGSTFENDNEKINWKEYFTKENIERFAPLAALIPLAMAVIVGVIGRIFFSTLGSFSIGNIICTVLVTLIKVIFIAAVAGATAGLVYVIINFKDKSKVNVWVTPFATLLAMFSCVGIAFRWGAFSWILGIISVVLGVEFLARIVIAQQPIDSPVNPGAAFATYKQYYNDYKAKYPTIKDLEKKGIIDPENSKFDGTGLELFGYTILASIVCIITCGIAAPWMICKIYKWRISHTVINGKRLTFTGSGGSLLGHWILWEILTVVTCGIYGFFLHVALRKWELNHTYIDGEPIVANGNESFFDGGSFTYFGYGLISGLLLAITCGLSYPWVMTMLQKWDTKHQVINGRRLEFTGSGLGFLGEFLIIFILSIVTCGIYSPWGTVRLNKYIVRHTDFVN